MGRESIYYWKCDRPSAFHGISGERNWDEVAASLAIEVAEQMGEIGSLKPVSTQGNHGLWRTSYHGKEILLRVEDGEEKDDYQLVESHLLEQLRKLGVPTPWVYGGDSSRGRVPYAWQALEWFAVADLQKSLLRGDLNIEAVMPEIGRAVARWQRLKVDGFGPFDTVKLRIGGELVGFHSSYWDYYSLNLDKHLRNLVDAEFLEMAIAKRIMAVVNQHQSLLNGVAGCLVHKDLAFWNILGAGDQIVAFIDFDDAIAGDAMDDLSLLACFHEPAMVSLALQGYRELAVLPDHWQDRLMLSLLRNLITKAVIRAGAGYFEKSDNHFLIASGSSGHGLRTETYRRIVEVLEGLEHPAGKLITHHD